MGITYTSHYNLAKPDGSEKIGPSNFNSNSDTIDSLLYTANASITTLKSNTFNQINAAWKLLQSYTTSGTYTWTAPDVFGDGRTYKIGVYIKAGGGGGGACYATYYGSSHHYGTATGGASGRTKVAYFTVTPGTTYTVVVGAGGAGGIILGSSASSAGATSGSSGGSSAFNGTTASGGGGGGAATGTLNIVNGSTGGQGSDAMGSANFTGSMLSTTPTVAPAMGEKSKDFLNFTYSYLAFGGNTYPAECVNPFTGVKTLGAGGSANCDGYSTVAVNVQTCPTLEDGLSAGTGVGVTVAGTAMSGTGGAATSPGSGGGAAACGSSSTSYAASGTVTGGAGAAGAVYIYIEGVAA